MERVNDEQGRWRNRLISFRMSQEEGEVLNRLVKLSGLTKQEYVIRKLTNQEVVVQGNTRVHRALKHQMKDIHNELQRIKEGSEISKDLEIVLSQIGTMLEGLQEREGD